MGRYHTTPASRRTWILERLIAGHHLICSSLLTTISRHPQFLSFFYLVPPLRRLLPFTRILTITTISRYLYTQSIGVSLVLIASRHNQLNSFPHTKHRHKNTLPAIQQIPISRRKTANYQGSVGLVTTALASQAHPQTGQQDGDWLRRGSGRWCY